MTDYFENMMSTEKYLLKNIESIHVAIQTSKYLNDK